MIILIRNVNNPINQVIANQDVHALTQKKKQSTKTSYKNGLQKGISEFVRGDCKPKAKVLRHFKVEYSV